MRIGYLGRGQAPEAFDVRRAAAQKADLLVDIVVELCLVLPHPLRAVAVVVRATATRQVPWAVESRGKTKSVRPCVLRAIHTLWGNRRKVELSRRALFFHAEMDACLRADT